jgi:hypothetical protein
MSYAKMMSDGRAVVMIGNGGIDGRQAHPHQDTGQHPLASRRQLALTSHHNHASAEVESGNLHLACDDRNPNKKSWLRRQWHGPIVETRAWQWREAINFSSRIKSQQQN